MNTTVFAEEVAVDSVEDTVEATVDSAEEITEDASVDEFAVEEATVDGVIDTNYGSPSASANNYYIKDEKGEWATKVTYDSDDNVTITNVYSPVSWNEIVEDEWSGDLVYGAPELIETVLTGSYNTDSYLVNKKAVKVSDNRAVDVPGLAYGYRTYDVEDLGSGYYLFVGYGSLNSNYDAAIVDGVTTGFAPVIAWDGRAIDWAKSGYWKASNSKEEALDVDIAVAKYEGTTLTKVPGVEVKKVKVDKKTAKHATVSGQSVNVKASNGRIDAVWNALSGYTNPTFQITAKLPKELKDQKKTINNFLKDQKYTFAISQKLVYADAVDLTYTSIGDKGLSTNDLEDWGILREGNEDQTEFDLSDGDFTISNFDESKGKANIVLNVRTYNGKKLGDATIALKSGKKDSDYEFTDGSLAGDTVKVLKFVDNGNYAYFTKANDYDADDESFATLTAEGYKFAFEATPNADSKKKVKTFRKGIFKDSNDGFVYSVED